MHCKMGKKYFFNWKCENQDFKLMLEKDKPKANNCFFDNPITLIKKIAPSP